MINNFIVYKNISTNSIILKTICTLRIQVAHTISSLKFTCNGFIFLLTLEVPRFILYY